MEQSPPLASDQRLKLPLHSPALAAALRDGSLPMGELPRELTLIASGPGPVLLRPVALVDDEVELAVGAAPGRPSSAKVWLEAVRAVSLTATATPCIAALLAVIVLRMPVAWGTAALAGLGALLLQLCVNLNNDVEDYRRLIDLPGTLGGAGILQKGWLSVRAVERVSRLCLVLGVVCGVPALLRAPVPMAVVGLLAAVGTAGYSGRPFGFKYKALGDLDVILLCGPALTLGFGVAAAGALLPALVPLGLVFGLLAVGILHTNNLQDIDADRARAATTVAGLLGERASRAYLVGLYVASGVAWIATVLSLHLPLIGACVPALALIPTSKLLRKVLGASSLHAPELSLIRVEAAQLHLAWGVLCIVGLGVAAALR